MHFLMIQFYTKIYQQNQVRFAILPDMLKNAPMLNVDKKSKQPRGLGRGAFRGIGRGRGMMPGGGGRGGGGGHRGDRGGVSLSQKEFG